MPKFRKKPVVIEAVQYSNSMREHGKLPDGVHIVPWDKPPGGLPPGDYPTIHTLEGDHLVSHGDWVITGVKGEKYPCKDDIFKSTYEPAE